MDRRSFINRDYLTTDAVCGFDDCLCKTGMLQEEQLTGKIKLLHLLWMAAGAFLCVIILSLTNGNMPDKIFRNNGNDVIACSPMATKKKTASAYLIPNGRKQENKCPHQTGIICISCVIDTKRKRSSTG